MVPGTHYAALYLEIQLFISIIAGPAEIGGGIYAWFQFDWSIGNVELVRRAPPPRHPKKKTLV